MSTLGSRIREAREQQGMNQSELAKLCGVKTPTAISNWETDANKPDVDKLVRICIALDTSPEVLLDYYPDGSKNLPLDAYPLIEKYCQLDESGKGAVNKEIDYQLEIAANRERGYSAVTFLPINKPVWLTKDDPEYTYMKIKARELKKLKEVSYKNNEDITKFLWSIGYEKDVCLAYIIGVVDLGTRVPNRQLYNRIKAFLLGKYKITVEETDEE